MVLMLKARFWAVRLTVVGAPVALGLAVGEGDTVDDEVAVGDILGEGDTDGEGERVGVRVGLIVGLMLGDGVAAGASPAPPDGGTVNAMSITTGGFSGV